MNNHNLKKILFLVLIVLFGNLKSMQSYNRPGYKSWAMAICEFFGCYKEDLSGSDSDDSDDEHFLDGVGLINRQIEQRSVVLKTASLLAPIDYEKDLDQEVMEAFENYSEPKKFR